MTGVRLLVFCVVLANFPYSDEAHSSDDTTPTPPETTKLSPDIELLPFELDESPESEGGAAAVKELKDEEHINNPTNALTPSTTTYLKNGGIQTKDILSTLLRNIEKTEDDLEAVKKSVHNLIRNINSEREKQLNPFTSKSKKYSVILYMKRDWLQATKHCKHRGMELATIENESEQRQLDAILHEIDYENFPLWIAASDVSTEGVFTWSPSGKPITYSNWNLAEPNGKRDENCAVLIQTSEGYFWDDRSCNSNFKFVCQYFD